MESGQQTPSSQEAAQLLATAENTTQRAAQVAPSRAYSWFMLCSAALIAGFTAMSLLAMGGRPVEEVATSSAASLAVLPIITFSGLVSGARERFGRRSKASTATWVALSLLVVSFGAALGCTLAGLTYPWWLNLLAPVAVFGALAWRPITRLSRDHGRIAEPWPNLPLPAPARWVTVGIGLAFGAVVAVSTQPWYPLMQVPVFLVVVIVIASFQAPWGLPRTGLAWGPIHWAAFAAVSMMVQTLVLLIARTDVVTAPLTIALGAIIAAVMAIAALWPTPRHGGV